jgi:hypothetical protein
MSTILGVIQSLMLLSSANVVSATTGADIPLVSIRTPLAKYTSLYVLPKVPQSTYSEMYEPQVQGYGKFQKRVLKRICATVAPDLITIIITIAPDGL